MRPVWLVAALAGCGFHAGHAEGPADASADGALDTGPGAWLAGESYRKPVVVTPGGASTSLADYPLAIRIPADPDLLAHARSDGADLVVTGDDALAIRSSELAYYNPAAGAAELWVSVPALPLDGTTTLYLYYGGAASPSTAASVWGADYKGVWHLSSTTATEPDSTGHHHDLAQAIATQVPAVGAGAAGTGVTLGRARAFDGIDDSLAVPDPADGSLDVGAGDFAVSLWVYATASKQAYDTPLYKGGTNGGNPGYAVFAGQSSWECKIMDTTGTFTDADMTSGPTLNAWRFLVASVKRGPDQWTTYANGTQAQQATFNLGSLDGTAPLEIGDAGEPFQGSIDEVRLYARTLAPEWVQTDYDSFAKAGFLAIGAEASAP